MDHDHIALLAVPGLALPMDQAVGGWGDVTTWHWMAAQADGGKKKVVFLQAGSAHSPVPSRSSVQNWAWPSAEMRLPLGCMSVPCCATIQEPACAI